MEKAGDIYLAGYQGWYSVRDEAFYAESETVLGANGVRLGPQGTPVEWTEEQTYFFRLSKYEKKLLKLYEENPDFILPPERRNEIVNFVKGGLQDLSISRTTLDWGIPVPGAPGHIIYVWVDALTNYITAAGFPKVRSKAWKERWPAQLHVIGKDITRFHAVYWPAFLMSAKIPLPERVFSHGFLYNKGEKMSKSVGNVVAPLDMAAEYGADQVRYFFLREVPFGQDGSFTHEAIVNRINADLANDLGNLAQRSLSMIAKNCASRIPEPGNSPKRTRRCSKRLQPFADVPRGDGPAGHPQVDRGHLASRCRSKPIFRGAGALVVEKDGPGAHGHGAVRDGRGGAARGDLEPALCAGFRAEVPRSAWRAAGGERAFASLERDCALKPGTMIATPQPVFPRYVEDETRAAE